MSEKGNRAEDAELEEARAGLRAWISAKATARFLGVHVCTLGEWRRQRPPKGPAWTKGAGAGTGGGSNQRVLYDYQQVVDWVRGRFDRTPREEQLLDELQTVRDRAREVELELLLRREKSQLRRLAKRQSRKSPAS